MRTLTLPLLGLAVIPLWLLRAPRAVLEFCSGGLFLILFLIYPSTSAAIFATFQCEPLDDGTSWLRADLSIDCNSPTHNWYVGYASWMVLVFPLGTPLLYYVILRCNKKAVDRLRVNQALRVQLLEKVRAEDPLEAAALCRASCNPKCSRLQPYVLEAATLYTPIQERAEGDYASSRVSGGSRFVPWVISKKERALLPIGTLRKLRKLECEASRPAERGQSEAALFGRACVRC